MIRYSITPAQPDGHIFEVRCLIPSPAPEGQRVSLPAWIPGSYMIREFARNIVRIRARANGRAVRLRKLDKHTWLAAPCAGPLELAYEVYAWDMSVRCAHLDRSHGFFNGTQVFLCVAGAEHVPHLVDIRPPDHPACAGWRVATTLPEASGLPGAARRYGFGLYRADDYDELVDHPVEMGTFELIRFEAAGVPHEMAITGRVRADLDRLAADLARVCAWHIKLFRSPAPFKRYLFLTCAVGDGYGGLEHRSSTALICARDELPAAGSGDIGEGYLNFLGLCSHEYFHSWNVKRIKPAAFVPYDLSRENHTTLLWAFEGFTSYYDDLALRRCGLIPATTWLQHVAKTVSAVHRGTGRLKQSLADASYDAWIKYYRQDENAPNAIVSYYAKGALVGMALDLTLRTASGGRVSLDDVMRRLWREFGQTGLGVPEDGIRRAAEAVSGLDLRSFFAKAVEGTTDLPLASLLAGLGVDMRFTAKNDVPAIGAKTAGEGGHLKLQQVFEGGAAQRAGLSAGDTLIALDGVRVTGSNLDKLLGRYRAGDRVQVHAFRRDELLVAEMKLAAAPADQCELTLQPRPGAAARRMRKAWLGE